MIAVKNMISVTRNIQMASFPLGNGSPMWAACGSSATACAMSSRRWLVVRGVAARGKARSNLSHPERQGEGRGQGIKKQQCQQHRQIQERRLQHPAGLLACAAPPKAEGGNEEA